MAGQWFKPFALTIACSVLVSLFVSFSLDPMLSAYWPDPHVPRRQNAVRSRARSTGSTTGSTGWRSATRGVIGWALDHRWRWSLLAVATFVGGARAAGDRAGGRRLLPGLTTAASSTCRWRRRRASNLDYTRLKVAGGAARSRARTQPEVRVHLHDHRWATASEAGAWTRAASTSSSAPKDERASRAQEEIGAMLRDEVKRIGGADVSVFTDGLRRRRQADPARSCAATSSSSCSRCADAVLAAVRHGAGRRGRRPLHQGPEAGARHRGGPRRSPVRSASRSGRWRSRCARPSPASTSGDWVDPVGRDARRDACGSRRGARARRRPRAAADRRGRPGRPVAADAARPGGARARSRSGRRSSTTSTATP